jgi:hypothetical protein
MSRTSTMRGRPRTIYDVKRSLAAILCVSGMWIANPADAGCPDGQLQFAFSNLKVRDAFAILADFAGLKPEIDRSLTQSEPIAFGCTPWRAAAQDLADRHSLSLRIENGYLYVARK